MDDLAMLLPTSKAPGLLSVGDRARRWSPEAHEMDERQAQAVRQRRNTCRRLPGVDP